MVKDEVSLRKISIYLHHWATWWVRTTGGIWNYIEVLRWFLTASWDLGASANANARQRLFQYHITSRHNEQVQTLHPVFEVNRAAV